jgi:ABC-2 type transport system ATP-binding protein
MTAIAIDRVAFRYGDRPALRGVSFDVGPGEIFGLLGPNGGGKTTLFRLVATLLPLQEGTIRVLGVDVAADPDSVRRLIGVTFQSPSLDGKLTVRENLTHHGHLFGLSGRDLRTRCDELLERLKLTDRAGDSAETLSGGLKRRVEIAKGLLHDPRVLLLDEPSTGLDPGARHDLWRLLDDLRTGSGVTTFVTTHLMEEADRCDRLGILSRGELVALGTPDELRSSIGGDCLTIQSLDPESLARRIREQFQIEPQQVAGALRIEQSGGHELLRNLVEAFPKEIASVSLGKPTLEDVFIARTGHRFWDEDEPPPEKKRRR